MIHKAIFFLLIFLISLVSVLTLFPQTLRENPTALDDSHFGVDAKKSLHSSVSDFDFDHWLILDETSAWTTNELKVLERVMRNAFGALEEAGLDGNVIFNGYFFRRFQGECAKNRRGKIAVVSFSDKEIILSDSIFQPEYEFFIYHELGHVVDYYSEAVLDEQFHKLIMQIEGVTSLHDWTTAQGFYLRGQAHIKKSEATADAFALWVWVDFAGKEIPNFYDMPSNANPEAILDVFRQALKSTFQVVGGS